MLYSGRKQIVLLDKGQRSYNFDLNENMKFALVSIGKTIQLKLN